MKSALLISCVWLMIAAVQSDPPPGGIVLLHGYQHKTGQGMDSNVGTIWRENFKIEYDIGELAGDYTNCKTCGWTQGEVWRKRQVVNGQLMVSVLTKTKESNRLVVSFPRLHANFYATINSHADMADMLQMIATYPTEKSGQPKLP